jgi:hypothetical protein
MTIPIDENTDLQSQFAEFHEERAVIRAQFFKADANQLKDLQNRAHVLTKKMEELASRYYDTQNHAIWQPRMKEHQETQNQKTQHQKTKGNQKMTAYQKMRKARSAYEKAMGLALIEALEENNNEMNFWVNRDCKEVIMAPHANPYTLILLSKAGANRINEALVLLGEWQENWAANPLGKEV